MDHAETPKKRARAKSVDPDDFIDNRTWPDAGKGWSDDGDYKPESSVPSECGTRESLPELRSRIIQCTTPEGSTGYSFRSHGLSESQMDLFSPRQKQGSKSSGGRVTKETLRLMAEHVATFEYIDEETTSAVWGPFSEQVCPLNRVYRISILMYSTAPRAQCLELGTGLPVPPGERYHWVLVG
jgi:hypothetical protein